ncbi:MAG: exo-alpha-sialidase [Isosphaeraceae bacterium]
MKAGTILLVAAVTSVVLPSPRVAAQQSIREIPDARNITTGHPIPDEGYCDQPYVVVADDGQWVCVMTTGKGVEGESGQHIVATRSADHGRSWSPAVSIEPADGPEASWAMPLKVPGGRIYVFYTYNADNLRKVPQGNSEAINRRVDTLGQYCFKFSDDGGKTWSRDRYPIPTPKTRLDRENNTQGSIQFFWGVGKPIVSGSDAIFGFAKVGKWGAPGAMVRSQGMFLRSDNILTERDPGRIHWMQLPDGDEGLRAPKGPVSDEANLVSLSDGSLYATYRTIDGYPCHAYSRDGGHTWTPPAYATYTPNGRRIKHPRAANFVRKFSNGKYLYWYHNHGGEPFHLGAINHYLGRNPAWICGGVERDGFIHWSEPEILLYDDDPATRMSYPDFIEENGRFFVTETQKTIARVHEIDAGLLAGVWNQSTQSEVVRRGLAVEVQGNPIAPSKSIPVPRLADLRTRQGFSIDLDVRFDELTAGQVLLDTRDRGGKGIRLAMSERSTLRLTLNDGREEASWDSDPGTGPGTLSVGNWHHITVIVDAGPRIIAFVVDGILNDGGALREYGWGRFPKSLSDINGLSTATLAPRIFGQVRSVRLYDRALRISEAVSNRNQALAQAGKP